MKFPVPPNEAARLAKLGEFDILDSLPETEYEDLVALAAEICQMPVAQISLIDAERQWYKAEYGIKVPGGQTPREDAFCAHTIMDPDRPLVVPDMRIDDRFKHNKFVAGEPRVVFYAGFPLRTEEGYAVGTLCVLDQKPRNISASHQRALIRLSKQVVKLLELRLSLRETQTLLREKEHAYRLLTDFSHIVAHDLKAPVRNIQQASEMLREDCFSQLSPSNAELFEMIEVRAKDASRMIDGVLRYSKVARSRQATTQPVGIPELIDDLREHLGHQRPCRIEYIGEVTTLHSSPVALTHIFQNLIGNALKFNDKTRCDVVIDGRYDPARGHIFTVSDNGPGIPAHELDAVFNLFHSPADDERRGHGVGLSIVRRLVEDLAGTVSLTSEIGHGATFTIVFPDHSTARQCQATIA